MTGRIGVLIVLYRKTIEESETLQSLLNLPKETRDQLEIFIWDNSPESLPKSQISSFQNHFRELIHYTHTKENISLAIIYNRSIDKCLHCKAIVLFDQDSDFNSDYFRLGLEALAGNPSVNLFLPVVKNGDQIVSPGDFVLVKGKYWTNLQLGKILAKNKVAIASGMLIRISFLEKTKIRFNESLKLYNIDTDFMLKYSDENVYFFVFPYELKHRISTFEAEAIDKTIMRFRDFRRSLFIINVDRGFKLKILSVLYAVYLSIKNFYKYFDIRFLY